MDDFYETLKTTSNIAYDKGREYTFYYMGWELNPKIESQNNNDHCEDDVHQDIYDINNMDEKDDVNNIDCKNNCHDENCENIEDNENCENIECDENNEDDCLTDHDNSQDDHKDSIEDYKDYLSIKNYEDENVSNRIFPEPSFLERGKLFFDDPTFIVDNIYLGSAYNAGCKNTLKKYDIKVIINITEEIRNYHENDKDIIYINHHITDNNHDNLTFLKEAYEQILYHQKNTTGNILVHCFMGRSRSASVVLYYLMKTQKNNQGKYLSFDEASAFIRDKRQINPTFRVIKDVLKLKIEEDNCDKNDDDN